MRNPFLPPDDDATDAPDAITEGIARAAARVSHHEGELLLHADVDRAAGAFHTRLHAQLNAHAERHISARPSYQPRENNAKRWWLGGAIGIALTALVTLFVQRTSTRVETTVRTYATTAGKQAIVTLEDGSRAVLAPSTSLHVATNRANGAVTVTLDGQALFTVVHRTETPFVVHTAQSATRVLGTTFLVRRYSTDRTTRIVVADGRVALQSTRGPRAGDVPAVLGARTLGVVDDSGRVIVTSDIALAPYMGWTTGELTFRGVPVREIIADLNRAYDADIRVSDSTLANRPITWSIQTTRYPLAQALHELTLLSDAHVVQSGKTITLIAGRRGAQRSRPARPLLTPEFQYGR